MTRDEAIESMAAYFRLRPSVSAKLQETDDPRARKEIYNGWLAALERCDTEDVDQVLLRIRVGDDEPIPAYDWESTGAIIRRRAEALARSRREIIRDRSGEAELTFPNVSKLIAPAIEATRGMTPEQRRAKLRELYPDDERSAVRCRDCNDTGMVDIVHHLTLRMIFSGRVDSMKRTDWKSYPVPCTCQAGDQWTSEPNKHSEGRQRRYNDKLDCRLPRGGMTVCFNHRAQVLDWAAAYDATKARPNYSNEFEGGVT